MQDYLPRDPIAACPFRRFAVSFVNVVLIVATFLAVTPTQIEACIATPVFIYYHGDHLGSANIITDRNGTVVDHYEYYAFGKDRYNDGCSFQVANKYTGQVKDDETGLYYYNARYYDPEIGRFIQADRVVPTAADPQTLNRYSYCNNNPLNSTDPSGHEAIVAAIVVIVVAVAVNVGIAAATGGDIGKAAVAGAVGAVVGLVVGYIASVVIGQALGAFSGAAAGAIGGAAGGAASAAVSGGNVGMGALTGAIGGALGGASGGWTKNWGDGWGDISAKAAVSICTGSLGGGIGAAIQGGDILQGMAMGAAGAAVGFAVSLAMSGRGNGVVEQVKEDHGHPGNSEIPEIGIGNSEANSAQINPSVSVDSTVAQVSIAPPIPVTPSSAMSPIISLAVEPSLSNTGGVTTASTSPHGSVGPPAPLMTDATKNRIEGSIQVAGGLAFATAAVFLARGGQGQQVAAASSIAVVALANGGNMLLTGQRGLSFRDVFFPSLKDWRMIQHELKK